MAKLLTEEQYNELIARLERAERRASIAVEALRSIANPTEGDWRADEAQAALDELSDMDGARPHG